VYRLDANESVQRREGDVEAVKRVIYTLNRGRRGKEQGQYLHEHICEHLEVVQQSFDRGQVNSTV
jgi:hypothetical protein